MVALTKRLSMVELIRFQDGLIRRDQALSGGLPRSAVDGHLRSGRWQRVLPTVYLTDLCAFEQEPRLHNRQLIRSAWMWAGDDAVITGSAAAVWAGHLEEPQLPIGVSIPPNRRLSEQPDVHVARATIERRDTTSHNGILITRPSRTAVDLAADGCNDLLHRMAGNWLRQDALQAALERGAHRRGWATARVAVRQSGTNPHSEAERVTHRALVAAGISGWRANVELLIAGRRFRPDLIFDEVKLIVEIDGFAYHGDREAFERDRERQNVLTAAGWTVLRFTWRQVRENPPSVIAQIEETRRVLRSRLSR